MCYITIFTPFAFLISLKKILCELCSFASLREKILCGLCFFAPLREPLSAVVQGLEYVFQDVVHVFETNGDTDQSWGDAYL
ncbi:hypothetical protein SAMN05660909_02521 [Chitinophaga terrae (ex Kim and Jung 2007)]|uniref:Uncharacterized protein n=1 Tax=Chitinophaga terrae (ex Kim and Jung 2007) TaxID=408074 RepID=A0A1H4CB86_9BACT|nr:hypothetical protein SAMN05660909_02521 [Chitinophaga terrae (ex Kim and Jung 2007)]